MCKVLQLLKAFSLTWSSFAVFVIGLDRTVSLLLPLMGRYSPRKRSLVIIIPSIIVAFCACLPSSVFFELYDGPVCTVERFRQCVDFLMVERGAIDRGVLDNYYFFLMILQFVIPTVGNLICYTLLIWEVTKMVRSERRK